MATVMSKTLPELMTQMVEKFESCLNKLLATFENKPKDRMEMLNGELYNTNVRIDTLERKLTETEDRRQLPGGRKHSTARDLSA